MTIIYTKLLTHPITGIYLKLHGSLDWGICTNNFCPRSQGIQILGQSSAQSLAPSALGGYYQCEYCKGELTSYLIPPLLNKPILKQSAFRNIWGNALYVLQNARNIIVIGYSFPATDFYAQWLFRTALKDQNKKVWIVNPENDPNCETHRVFMKRMEDIFGNGWSSIVCLNTTYFKFDQIEEILREVENK